jgi:hypothetical protein
MIAKKWISILLTAAVMTAAMAGCGGQAALEETAAGQTLAAAVEEKPEPVEVKAGVFYYYGQDAFISRLQDSVNTALEEAGIAYENYDAGNDQETQLEQIREAIDGGCHLLIVNLVDKGASASSSRVCDLAAQAEIPDRDERRPIWPDPRRPGSGARPGGDFRALSGLSARLRPGDEAPLGPPVQYVRDAPGAVLRLQPVAVQRAV